MKITKKQLEAMSEQEAKRILLAWRLELFRPILQVWADDYKLKNLELDQLFEEGGDLG